MIKLMCLSSGPNLLDSCLGGLETRADPMSMLYNFTDGCCLFPLQIRPGSIAEKVGLKAKDSLVKIGNDCALDYTIDEALESLKRGKDFFDMIVER